MTTISDLPHEIISIILQGNDCRDILNFAATCKRFHVMVKSDRCLWKYKFKSILPEHLFHDVEEHTQGDWFAELKYFYSLKQIMGDELLSMSSQCYWRNTDVTFQDVRNIFGIALSSSLSYYYTIYSLHELIKKSKKYIDDLQCKKPYTLTESYHGRVALRHLLHTYLAVKWVREHVKGELLPEFVINFFMQWVDTDNLHLDEDVQNKIIELVKKVEIELDNKPTRNPTNYMSIAERCARGVLSERKVLAAVSQVLYHQRHMAVTAAANLDTLDIVKVLNNKCGNVIALAAVYQAVARRCGVHCQLVAFPSHLFLEWRDEAQPRQVYTVDLATGALHPKKRCPFSQNHQQTDSAYEPAALLQYIYTSFHITMGAFKNWNMQNALHLLDFMGTYDNEYNPYRKFLTYLLSQTHLPAMSAPLNLNYLTDAQLEIMTTLTNLNPPFKTVNRKVTVKTRDSRIKFAVGMICYHTKYHYVGIVHGWDAACAPECSQRAEADTLALGLEQPFYHVVAADQSERYVAQENLTHVSRSRATRLHHLEECVARQFTHFDGFAYQPNEHKRAEYPHDAAVADHYRNRLR